MPGSIRQRGPRSWQVRVSLGRDPATGRYRYVGRYVTGTKRDAQAAAAQLATEVTKGGHQNAGRHTVKELLDAWMIHIEAQGRAASTLERYRSSINANIVPALADVRVDKLTGADLDAFYARLLAKGLNPLSVRKCHAILSASLRQAIRWGWIDRNPIDRASPPSPRHRELRIPTVEEIRALLARAEKRNPDLATLIYTAATTGCRRGELCGLQWADVDLDTATLVVRRSASDADGAVTIKDTKTHGARRLSLDASTVAVLGRHRLAMEERAAAAGTELGQDAFVFSQALDGTAPYRPNRVTSTFNDVRDQAGLKGVTFHSLRHFSATALAASGVGVRTIAGRLGHVDPNLTLRTYAHFLDAADREAAHVMGPVAAGLLALAEQPAS